MHNWDIFNNLRINLHIVFLPCTPQISEKYELSFLHYHFQANKQNLIQIALEPYKQKHKVIKAILIQKQIPD